MNGRAVRLALLAAAGLFVLHAAASVPWWPSYESGRFFVAGTVAVGAGILVGLLGARFALPPWAVAVGTLAAYVVLGVPAAVPGRALFGFIPTPGGLLELLAAVATSWQQLVTVPVPVGSFEALLVPYFLLALVSAVTATSIALRSTRPGAAVLPPAVLFLVGIVLGAERSEVALPAAVAAAAATVLWLAGVAWTRRRRRRLEVVADPSRPRRPASRMRRVAAVAAMLAVAAAGGTAAAALPQQRTVARSLVQPPFDPSEQPSPLAAYRAAFEPGSEESVELEVDGLPAGQGLRLATLDRYDGVVYRVGGEAGGSSRFTRVPYRLDQSTTPGRHVSLAVRIADYDETWLPSLGALERVEFLGPRAAELDGEVFVQPSSGTLATGVPLRSGDGYRLDAIADTELVPEQLVPGDSAVGPNVSAPVELLRLLDRWRPAGADPGPGERLAALVDGFRREGYLSHGGEGEAVSRSGHAIDRIVELATAEPMLGDAEQYAVAASLLAAELGFPARVVVGFAGGEQRGDTTVFRARDRSAWLEVQDASGTWFAFDPTPPFRPVPERQPEDPTVVSQPDSVLPPPDPGTPVEEVDEEAEAGADEPRADQGDWAETLRAVVLVAGGAAAALGLLVSPFVAVLAAKRRRRRLRRSSGAPADRIVGAWAEVVDDARDHGAVVPAPATRVEQAEQIGGIGATVLAHVIDRQLFGPDPVTEADVAQAWALSDRLRQSQSSGRGLRDRFRAAVSLVTFGGGADEPTAAASSTSEERPVPVTAGR